MNHLTVRFVGIFKRHYHKVRKAQLELASAGSFGFQLKSENELISARTTVPDEEKTIRFAVLMRRFLSPSDRFHYQAIWHLLKEQFSDQISAEWHQRIETSIAHLKNGYLGINIEGEKLTAEKVYQLIAEGAFFNEEKEAAEYLKSLADISLLGPLFWHQFYAYTVEGFTLVSQLFDLVREIERTEAYQKLSVGLSRAEYRCIYCLNEKASFTSEEHVLPESLGNEEWILPRGYVCDSCNHGVLSDLDNALVTFEPVAFLRVQFMPYTKQGKLPRADFKNVAFERKGPRRIKVIPKDKTGGFKDKKDLGNGWYSYNVSMVGKKFDPVLLGRTLYKIGLGMAALSLGHTTVCSDRYQAARDFVRKSAPFPNNLLMCEDVKPTSQGQVSVMASSEGTFVIVNLYGFICFLNLESIPVMKVNEHLAAAHFVAYSLQGSGANWDSLGLRENKEFTARKEQS